MLVSWKSRSIVGAATLAVTLSLGAALNHADAQKSMIVLATESGAGVTPAATSGIAKVLSERASLTARVRTFSSPETWLPELDAGRADIGAHFSSTAWLVYNQIDSSLKLRNLRLLRSSAATTPLGFMVRADSDIRKVEDLKGKRVAGGYGGHPMMRRLAGGMMAAYGLDWADVQIVAVPAAPHGAVALVDGRVDAAWYAVFAPQTREAHSKIGVRFLPVEMTPERLAIAHEQIFPGVLPLSVEADVPWAPRGTQLISFEYYVMTSTHADDATVTKVLETMWAHDEEIRNIQPVLRGFTNANAVSKRAVLPYHPAAVAFYKSKGVWSAEAEAANAALVN